MALTVIRNMAGKVPVAPPKDNYPFEAKSGTEPEAGKVYSYDGNNETLVEAADAEDEAIVIAVDDADDGEDFRGQYILPGMVYRADCAGTGEPTHIKEGVVGMQLNDAEEVKDSDDTDGPLTILRVYQSDHDDDTYYADVVFCKSAFAVTTSA